jgi:tRNA-Thr(GGU) m(6)t(6)A37 methyltransferase TsaA
MTLQLTPIGILHTSQQNKFMLASQPDTNQTNLAAPPELSDRNRASRASEQGGCWVEVGPQYREALRDLEGFSKIWLIWWFHRNENWRSLVLPPRSRSGRKGVFATRSPHRPNPIGISAVSLLGVEDLRLYIGAHDLLDGTPILDIKPYIPRFDSFENEQVGWFGEVEETLESETSYSLEVDALAQEKLDWLNCNFHPDFQSRVLSILKFDPRPHRTRRISRMPDGLLRLGCENWRIFFRLDLEARRVEILDIRLRHNPEQLAALPKDSVYWIFSQLFVFDKPQLPGAAEF